MAAGGTEYTVFGFGSGFDGRPTVFLTAFPPTRVCSACGLVPSTAGLLPCRHVLCHRCYDRCIGDESARCPLDEEVFEIQDVVWSPFSKNNILDRKIRCWNSRNGCGAVGPASQILEHFNDACEYYAATCQRCRSSIAQKEAVDHVRSGTCIQEQSQAVSTLEGVGAVNLLESLQSLDNRLTESTRLSVDTMHEVKTSLERNVSAVRQFFRQEVGGILGQLESRVENKCSENAQKVLAACATIETATNDLKSASLDHKQKTVKALKTAEKAVTKGSGTEEQFLKLRKELDEKFSVVIAASKAVLENFGELKSYKPLEWTIDGWSKLKNMQKRGKNAMCWAEKPTFFGGYSILPGAEIVELEGILSLRLVFRLCKGLYDQLLTWPFEKQLCFKVIHPDDRNKIQCNIVTSRGAKIKALQLPTTSQNEILECKQGLAIDTLDADGYATNDKLLIRLELNRGSSK
ncbi:hypothetical protein HPB48_027115 [Haemaphysalis longicornis]|uniref:RING-type domain-containing protein n=1 Tax=Haemaphysalis longicornis TaxID=44386 RepID=A0A9J6HD50_HAELO|nr:hypothetical protein HPB48_027115 [Haemaphysalis longicornis]